MEVATKQFSAPLNAASETAADKVDKEKGIPYSSSA
jgi:hypothetical protein